MTTPRYRIGNDLSVFWAIHNRDGSPFDMEGMEVHLYMTNERGRKEVDAVLSSLDDGTINNVIRWDYAGEDQRVLGLHSLTVEILESNSHREIVKDYCEAFELVSRSNEETEEGDANVSVRGDLILSSKLDIYRFEAASVEVGDLKEDIKEITDSLQDINESIKGIGEESIEIKTTINGIQKEVNEIGTELSTKASVNSVIEIGEQITEVQENVAEQTIKVDGLSAEISTKASADSVTQIAGDLAITNKTLAEQSLKVTDLETEISTKASADSVTEIGEGLKTTAASLAEQVTKVTALESEISTKASSESVTQLASGLNLTNQTVAEQITRTDGIEASIENLVTKETFNAATGEIANEFTSIKQTTDSIETTIQSQSGEIASIKGGVSGLSVEIGKVQTDLDSLRDQLDGVTESYFYDYSPSNTNEPAKTWIENGTEASHKGDTFTNTALEGEGAGKSWRWLQASDGSWSWHPIADTDAQKALLLASQAQAAADGKVTIFYQLPDQYKVGDIWFVHSDEYHPYKKGEILSASETSAIFNLGHWESKTRYSKAVDDLNETMNTTFRDGVLDDAERKAIKDNLNNLYKDKQSVDSRYNTIVANADFNDTTLKNEFKAVKASYDSAYNSLVTIVEQIIAASTEGLKTLFASYENLMKTYREAYAAYNTKETEVTEALMGRLNHASRYLDNITNDGVLTPIEKEQLYEIYRGIAKEYAATRNNAFNYKIWAYTIDGVTEQAGNNGGSGRYELYLEFKRAYTPIVSAFNSSVWGFDKMDETTNLPSGYTTTQLKEYLDAYYSAQGTLTEVFSAITASIDEAQKKAEKTLNELTGVLSPEEMLTQVGKGVVLSTIIATKDTAGNITAAMNASNAYKDNSEDNHGRIIIAGGVKDIEDWNNANFVLYEDGHADLRSVNVSGYASITKLELGLKEKVDVRDYEQLLQAVNDLSSLFSPVYDNNGELVLIKANASFMARGYAAGATATVEEGGGGAILNKDSIISALGYTPYDATNPSGYITESALIGYATTDALANGLSAKQDTITDLATIRSNAKNGATAYGWGNHANAGYATTVYVDTKIANLINGAPTTLDTLKEIADALAENEDVVDALEAAIGTKANASDLTALAGRVTTAEGNIVTLTNGKADKASTLAGYGITDAYTKTEVDGNITTINGVLTTHDNRLKSLEDMWYLENGVVKSKYPMMTKGYAAGATASVSSSGGGGAILNKDSIINALGYTPYDSANPKGYITVSALTGYATQDYVSQQISNIDLSPYAKTEDVAAMYVTRDSFSPIEDFYNAISPNIYKVGDLLKIESDIIENNNGQSSVPLWIKGTDTWAGARFNSGFIGYFGGFDWRVTNEGYGQDSKLLHEQNYSKYALPLTGGWLSSPESNTPLTVSAPNATTTIFRVVNGNVAGTLSVSSYLALGLSGGSFPQIQISENEDSPIWRKNYVNKHILHEGNYSQYALSLSGGTISGPLTISVGADVKLILNSTDGEYYNKISVREDGEEYGELLFANNITSLRGFGNLVYNSNIVLTTNNIGSYKAGDSAALNGLSHLYYFRLFASGAYDANTISEGGIYRVESESGGSVNWPLAASYGNVIHAKVPSADTAFQIAAPHYAAQRLFFRSFSNSTQATQTWKEFAFTDSTVAAANKLVDDSGSARVTLDSSGKMIVGGAGMSIGGFSEFGNIIYANAYGNGRSKYAAILINKGGDRFGIGPSSTNTSDISFGVTSDILGTWKSEYLIFNSSGNVGIGTTSPAYKLDVAGTARISGAVTMNSTLTVGGHIAVTSTGNSYSGLYPNKSITDDDNDTRLWLYNAGELALYGSSIVMRSAVKMTNYLTVAGSAFFSSTHFNGYSFFNSGGEGIYISDTGQSINWHDADNAHVRTMMGFASDSITMHRNTLPSADNTYALGSLDKRWSELYANTVDTVNVDASGNVYAVGYIHSDEYISTDGDVRASGNVRAEFLQANSGVTIADTSLLSDGGVLSINADITPATDKAHYLGLPTKLWKGIYSDKIQTTEIKIGDATITWDAANGVLKIDKPIMTTGYAAGATATVAN